MLQNKSEDYEHDLMNTDCTHYTNSYGQFNCDVVVIKAEPENFVLKLV